MEMNTASVAPATENNPAPATVFGFAPEAVSAPQEPETTQAAGVETPQQAEQTGMEAEAPDGVVGQSPLTNSQKREVKSAFANERRRRDAEIAKAKAEFEQSPRYRFGDQLIRDVMEAEGIDEATAIGEVEKRLVEAFAKRENVSPGVARMLLTRNAAQPQPQQESNEEKADRIVGDLLSVQLPDGFDLDKAIEDEAFQGLLVELPASAAVRVYAAEQRVAQAEQRAAQAPAALAEQLRARQAIPQPMRTNQSVTVNPDYTNMPAKDFWALKERLSKY